MMDIDHLAKNVIEKLKSLPNEVLFTQSDVSPKTPWDTYKEHYQYEEDQIFNLEEFEELIKSYVDDELDQLTEVEILLLYGEVDVADFGTIFNEVKNMILTYIHDVALSDQCIEYNDPPYRYIKFIDDETLEDGEEMLVNSRISLAEVIMKKRPNEFLMHVFTRETLPKGTVEVRDLSYLKSECALEPITRQEFHKLKKNLNFLTLSDTFQTHFDQN